MFVSHAEGRTEIWKLQNNVLKTVMQPVKKELQRAFGFAILPSIVWVLNHSHEI
jgi:hypothetical protein